MLSDCELSGLTSQPDDPAASHLPVLPVRVPVYSPEITHNIKDRLKICQEQHHECNLTSQEVPILPHRVIEVGAEDSSTSARLFINDSLQRGEYTCLSYCWGGPQDVSTTTATLEQYSICLPSDKLPQTIRDAINITRSLAIRYLWVDALCIVQDDSIDKQDQICKMDAIYIGAHFTIVAACGADSRAGLPGVRTRSRRPQRVEIIRGITLAAAQPNLANALLDTQWHHRAWTFQEAVLSKRLLIFTDFGAYFQCSTALWCEDTHLEKPSLSECSIDKVEVPKFAKPFWKDAFPTTRDF